MSFGDFMFLFLQCYRQDYITAPKNQWTNHDVDYDFEFPSHAKKFSLAHRKPKFGVVHLQYRNTICKIRPPVLLVNLPPNITASLVETQSAFIARAILSAILNHGVWSSKMYSKPLMMASKLTGNSSVCLIARSFLHKNISVPPYWENLLLGLNRRGDTITRQGLPRDLLVTVDYFSMVSPKASFIKLC